MRAIFVIVLALLVSLGGSSPAAQQDASLTDTELAQTLWRIAATSHTRVGFQSIGMTRHRHLNASSDPEPVDFAGALDAAVAADPRYAWHMVAGTAVIRPREAWTDSADPLNHRVPAVQITNERLDGVLFGLSSLIFYNQFTIEPKGVTATAVSFPMKAGTVIDALNQLTEQAGQVMWVVYARRRDNPDGWDVCRQPGSCHADLQFDLRGAESFSARIATQPWAKK